MTNTITIRFEVSIDAPSEVQARARQLVIDALDAHRRSDTINEADEALVCELLWPADDEDRADCNDCGKRVPLHLARAIMLDDNGPGEPPSHDGYICEACVEAIEKHNREQSDKALATEQAELEAEGAALDAADEDWSE